MKAYLGIALGFFDGVHKAHQKIISDCVDSSKKMGLVPIVLTFDRSPQELLSNEEVLYITSLEEKKKIATSLGAKLVALELNRELLSMSAEEFAEEILVKKFGAKHISCGFDYKFGKNGDGDASYLIKLGEKYGFSVNVTQCVMQGDLRVSSSSIRTFLSEGKIKSANEMLARNFSISGTVQQGKKLGTQLGFPTANVFAGENTILPKNAVYKTVAIIDGKRFPAITNVGVNPTFKDEKRHTETYIPSISECLYDKEITIEFIDFIRDEKPFNNICELKEQIEKDIFRSDIK